MAFVPPDAAADASNRGFFGQGDMQKEFEEASFALKPGEISPVIETASGLHLIERYVLSTAPLVAFVAYEFRAMRRRFRQRPSPYARSRVFDCCTDTSLCLLDSSDRKARQFACCARQRADASLLTGHLPGECR
jgi:hypothetical protein